MPDKTLTLPDVAQLFNYSENTPDTAAQKKLVAGLKIRDRLRFQSNGLVYLIERQNAEDLGKERPEMAVHVCVEVGKRQGAKWPSPLVACPIRELGL